MKKIPKKVLKKYWKALEVAEDIYWASIDALEKDLSKETGIEDIEFFHSDNSCVGIGNASRTMSLIQRDYDYNK